MNTQGCDYSDARPSPAKLAAAGYAFVCRYLWEDIKAKGLSVAEAKSLAANGIRIVLNYESTANRAMAGYNAGVSDAQTARRLADNLGAPKDCVIYFSVDFATDAANIGPVIRYFEGAAKILGHARVGVYGSYFTIEALWPRLTVSHFWQTYAWSNGRWSPHAHLRQTHNGYDFHGSEIDLDTAVISTYGGFIMGQPETPAAPQSPAGIEAPWNAEVIPVHVNGVKETWQAAGTIGAIFDRLTQMPAEFAAINTRLDEVLSHVSGAGLSPANVTPQVKGDPAEGSLPNANDSEGVGQAAGDGQVDTTAQGDLGSDGAAYPR